MSGWMGSRKKLEAFPGDKPEKLRSAFLTQGNGKKKCIQQSNAVLIESAANFSTEFAPHQQRAPFPTTGYRIG